MKADFRHIESLVSDLETAGRAESVMASLAWSFAMSLGHSIVRLQRTGNPDDPTYANMSSDQLADTVKRLETRADDFEALLGWAAAQASPDFLPNGEGVMARLMDGSIVGAEVDNEAIEAIAKEMGASIQEIMNAQARNSERMQREASLQAEAAKLLEDTVAKAIDRAIACGGSPADEIDVYDAIRIVERIADKAADYADNALASALRQRRKRRRDELNATRRLMLDIENKADELLTRLERERDAVGLREEPAAA